MQPNHPHPPCFSTQSVLNSYPARTRSESRLRSSLHAIHSLAAYKNSDPFKWYPVVLHRWRCTAWFVQNPVAAQKEKHLRDGIMVENQLEHAYTYTHIRNVPDVRPRSTRDNVRCTANQPAVRQGERAEGPSWLCVDVIWAQRHALAVILGYCSIIQGKYAWRK